MVNEAKRYITGAASLLIVILLASCGKPRADDTLTTSKTHKSQETLGQAYLTTGPHVEIVNVISPTAGLEGILAALRGQDDPNPDDLARYERMLRADMEIEGPPRVLADMLPKMEVENSADVSTEALAKACFKSSVLARRQLASSQSNPAYALTEVKVFYPVYEEYLGRIDAWKGWLAAYSSYASAMGSNSNANELIDALIGMQTLTSLFWEPGMRSQLKGKELLFIEAQLEALKSFRAYLFSDKDERATSSTTFFSLTVPASLVNSALALMIQSGGEDVRGEIVAVTSFTLPENYTMGDVENYLDLAIGCIDDFCKKNALQAISKECEPSERR